MHKITWSKEFALDFTQLLKNLANNKDFEEFTFKIKKDHMRLYTMNGAKCVSVIADFYYDDISTAYDDSKFKEELIFNIKIPLLKKVINRLSNNEIDIEYAINKLVLKGERGKYNIQLYEPTEDVREFKAPKLIYNTEFNMEKMTLYEPIESGELIYTPTEEAVYEFRMSGGVFTVKTEKSKSSSYEHTFPDENLIKIEGKEADAEAKYASRYILLTKFPVDIVEVNFNTEYPLKLSYLYGDKSQIDFYIAPRVDNE